jgi:hypothetical protein
VEQMTERHKVFISYHHGNDQTYKNKFVNLMGERIVPWSVEIGDIDPNLQTETIRQRIRDEYLKDSTVTLVLIGTQTWQRKHVDWEISSSIRSTQYNPRSGLLGIWLPNHPDYQREKYNPNIIPPRLYDNIKCNYAKCYDWIDNPDQIQKWIHEVYLNRDKTNPDNSRDPFINNRSGPQWQD